MIDEDSWCRVLDIIREKAHPVVVVSATARTTRQLAAAAQTAKNDLAKAKKNGQDIEQRHARLISTFLAHKAATHQKEIEKECLQWIKQCSAALEERLEEIARKNKITLQQNDAILSLGEQLSAYLFAQCGKAYGLPTEWVDARTVIKTDSNFGSAHPNFSEIRKNIDSITHKVESNVIPVVGGFYGANGQNDITTLGFEGSDYSASLLGAAASANAVEIWTDVNGIYTCDPRTVSAARPIKNISFDDAEQLAMHGAKVLHPATIKPASSNSIPVHVKNIFKPEKSGTKIDKNGQADEFCKAIAYFDDATLLKVKTSNPTIRDHRLVEVFAVLDDYESSIITIELSKDTATVALSRSEAADELETQLSELTPVSKKVNYAMISLIGCTGSDEEKQTAYVQETLSATPAFLNTDTGKNVMNVAVDKEVLLASVNELHEAVFEKEKV